MPSSSVKKTLSKAEYLKHKNNNMIDKDICNKYSISKSVLVKLKADWGISNSRSTKKIKKTIAISSAPKTIDVEKNSVLRDENNSTNQVNVLNARISELEVILRETEEKLKICENEREALWRIQDILRSRLVV
ncbi:hypothetical protein P4H71_09085 [Paenibacillus kribbensis]|uniref:hypothetical protein n=1 Tax=Paenibacillus kribbensis TaxID=172713 RepID=UPI002DBB35EA|nr:hypothetical protein [Paenibacillus kribbensis]MEC0234479.1 hypothetical protein [Paenibacillus kribbensis]